MKLAAATLCLVVSIHNAHAEPPPTVKLVELGAWFAFEVSDGTDKATVYCAKANKHCATLDRTVRGTKDLKMFPPVVKLPAKRGTCAQRQAELLEW